MNILKQYILENVGEDMRVRLNTIIDKVKNSDYDWLAQNNIDVKLKGEYFIINYGLVGLRNEYNALTRGLVLDKWGNIVSFPFIRFFNLGEKEAAPVSLADSDIIEKLDGSLVGLVFMRDKDNKPIWHTRKMLSTHKIDLDVEIKLFTGGTISLMKEIGTYVKKLSVTPDLYNYTLMFEAIMSERPVVTKYSREELGLYLIGARDLETLEESSESELNEIAKRINAKRPRIFDIQKDFNSVKKMMDKFQDDFEGFVVRDRNTGERIKIKKESYLKRHRLIGKMSYKNLIPLYLAGEREEVEAYFPEAVELFDNINQRFDALIERVQLAYEKIKDIEVRKDYAQIVLSQYKDISQILFKLFGTHVTDMSRFINDFLSKISAESAINVLDLHDIEKEEEIDI